MRRKAENLRPTRGSFKGLRGNERKKSLAARVLLPFRRRAPALLFKLCRRRHEVQPPRRRPRNAAAPKPHVLPCVKQDRAIKNHLDYCSTTQLVFTVNYVALRSVAIRAEAPHRDQLQPGSSPSARLRRRLSVRRSFMGKCPKSLAPARVCLVPAKTRLRRRAGPSSRARSRERVRSRWRSLPPFCYCGLASPPAGAAPAGAAAGFCPWRRARR